MYNLTVRSHFDAAHHLRGYPGPCANNHGHRWVIEISMQGEKLNELGMLLDFVGVKKALATILDKLDHQDLNTIEPFTAINPTAENIAKFIYDNLFFASMLSRVTVWESPDAAISYSP